MSSGRLLDSPLSKYRLLRGNSFHRYPPSHDDLSRFRSLVSEIQPALDSLPNWTTSLTRARELFNLLINPLHSDFALSWHRDDVKATASPDEEREKLAIDHHGIQWNTALYDDDCLSAVPRSHRRIRTEEERKADLEGGEMPGGVTLQLKAGETVFYNNNIRERSLRVLFVLELSRKCMWASTNRRQSVEHCTGPTVHHHQAIPHAHGTSSNTISRTPVIRLSGPLSRRAFGPCSIS